jgi:adrenodoxin-NADP+ reductase
MLVLPPDKLVHGGEMAKHSDLPEGIMEILKKSSVKNVHIVGRRGPAQAKFTTKELRELLSMSNVSWQNSEGKEHGDYLAIGKQKLKGLERARRRVLELLDKHAGTTSSPVSENANSQQRNLYFHFLSSPHSFTDSSAIFASTTFPPGTDSLSSAAKTIPAPNVPLLHIDSQRTFLATGYTGIAIPGLDTHLNIQFDDRHGIIPNELGRVLDKEGSVIPGCYVAGWLKRGAEGVIAATWQDAVETGEVIAEDLKGWTGSDAKRGLDGVKAMLEEKKGKKLVDWQDWKRLNGEELKRGVINDRGEEREKIRERQEMWEILDK